ncbi:hypothetical protein ColTof4_13600 [Colletotrichum tofieldiae]|nr:hypothetical protein ColTof3_14552 [Colletotrichum tofieldiae]GKT81177.1 hypothetical protein ColTof4_13600 [Colletotrichum tofieldiae]
MSKGGFGYPMIAKTEEVDCSWWTSKDMKRIRRNFFYIANIDVSRLKTNKGVASVIPYDMYKPMNVQVSSISGKRDCVIQVKTTFENFITPTNAPTYMFVDKRSSRFVVNILIFMVNKYPVTVATETDVATRTKHAVSTFAKSMYMEPNLNITMGPNMYLIKDVMSDVWLDVDKYNGDHEQMRDHVLSMNLGVYAGARPGC